MKKTKRLVSFITATAFLLSSVAPGFAATVDSAYGRLNALGVAKGYTDGTIGADKNITRAEFAAVAVRMLGMEAAVSAAKGATKFKDVSSSHWASGYINLAVGNGVIKGYPTGNFAPEANVTYAEASAMLIRVLGYEPQTTGTWPTNYIGKAAQLGLLDGVNATDFNAAATRGNVFLSSDNALDVKVLKVVKDGYEEDTKSLMEKRLGVAIKTEGIVINTPNYGAAKGNVTIDPDTTKASDEFTVAVASGVNPNANYGEKVAAWVKDDKAFFFDVKTNASDIISDEAASDATGTGLKLKTKDKTYDFSATALDLTKDQVKRNFADVNAVTEIKKGDKVKVVLDANGKINYIEAWSYTPAVVKEVKASDEKLVFENEGTLELKDDTYTIVKDGKTIAIADIKAGDVVDYAENAGKTRDALVVTAKEVSGKLDGAIESGTVVKLTIGTTGYTTVALGSVRYSTDKGATWTAVSTTASIATGDFKPQLGKDVKAKLNQDGKVIYVISDTATSAAENYVWVKDVIRSTDPANLKSYLKIGKFDGTNTMHEATTDAKYNTIAVDKTKLESAVDAKISSSATDAGKDLPNSKIAIVALTADGKVDYVKDVPTTEFAAQSTTVTIDKTNMTITTGGTTLKVTADTKFIYKNGATATDDLDVKTLTWDSFKTLAMATTNIVGDGASTPAAVPVQVVHKDGKAKFVVINGAVSATTDYKYGMINAKGVDGAGKDYVEFNQKGTLTKVEIASQTSLAKESLVRFNLTTAGKINTVTEIVYDATVSGTAYWVAIVKAVNKTDRILTVVSYDTVNKLEGTVNKYVMYSADAEVYDLSGTTLVSKTIDDVINNKVKLYDPLDSDKKDNKSENGTSNDGIYDFIVIDSGL